MFEEGLISRGLSSVVRGNRRFLRAEQELCPSHSPPYPQCLDGLPSRDSGRMAGWLEKWTDGRRAETFGSAAANCTALALRAEIGEGSC